MMDAYCWEGAMQRIFAEKEEERRRKQQRQKKREKREKQKKTKKTTRAEEFPRDPQGGARPSDRRGGDRPRYYYWAPAQSRAQLASEWPHLQCRRDLCTNPKGERCGGYCVECQPGGTPAHPLVLRLCPECDDLRESVACARCRARPK